MEGVDGQPLRVGTDNRKLSTLGAEVNPTILEESKTMRSSGTGKAPSIGTTLRATGYVVEFPGISYQLVDGKVPRIMHSSPFRRTNSRRPLASILKQNPLTASASRQRTP